MTRDPQAWARLGRALREERERRNLTQDDVAEQAEVSRKSVQDAERGKVPRARVPYTLAPIARLLGWPAGSVEAVLDGAEPPSGWRDVPVQPQIDAEAMAGVISHAMIRATDHATAAEIREATRLAVDELRRQGLIPETNEAQPKQNSTK